MIRVLVAEDSITTRDFLVELLRSDPNITVVGAAANGFEAVAMTKELRPDLVTMDIRMPRMNGFEATRQIMVEAPTPIVVVSGSLDIREVEISMHALRAGALTVVAKPPGPSAPEFEAHARRFLETIKAMAQVKVVRRWPDRTGRDQPALLVVRNHVRARVVAIAASTGGPAALARILANLPGEFPLPVLVVQHIARDFVEGFAAWLNTAGPLRVKLAEDGERLYGRTVYIAPDDHHLGVAGNATVALTTAEPIDGLRPSATHLFESVATAFGRSAVAVILTGMGRDGVTGLRAVRAAGGRIFAQDEASSVVFGMPGSAIAEGLSDLTLGLDMMAVRIRELVEGPTPNGSPP